MAQLEVGSPMWWLVRLYTKIISRRPTIERLANYYDGRHNLAFTSEKFLQSFGGLFRAFADNWTQIVVDAVEERLSVQGFRIPTETAGQVNFAEPNAEADREAWRIWQENELDAQSKIAHTEALLHGASYVTVWPGDDPATPDVTVEHPSNAIVQYDTKRRKRRTAALRVYLDEVGIEHAELFLPDGVYLYRSPQPRLGMIVDPGSASWLPDTDASPDGKMDNPFKVIPMVELPNRPRLYVARGIDALFASSEIAPVIPLQDTANKLLADMIVASEFHAFPQRWLTGYEAQRDETTNQVKPLPFKADSTVWWLEDPEAKFGAFPTGDLSNYTKALEAVVQHIASITRTPPHYLNGQADRLSGESIHAAESGLVAKIYSKHLFFGEAWEEVIRLCGVISGNAMLANSSQAEIIWKDPESRTESEHIDATVKLLALDLPAEFLWERAGLSPQQIARAKAMQADRLLLNDQAAPLPAITIRG